MTTKTLLVVDDVPEILQLFERLTKSYRTHDVQVVTMSDPAAARELVRHRDFDVVVSDYRMPHVDGVSVLAAARAHHPEGRRVLMTGYNEIPATEGEIEAAGLDARLKKPMRAASLLEFFQAVFSDDPRALDSYRADGPEQER